MIDYAVNRGVGVCIWYVRGILETYPNSFASKWGGNTVNSISTVDTRYSHFYFLLFFFMLFFLGFCW